MMLYQQYMTYAPAAFSTNDTYIPTIENQGLQNFPEEENPYDDWLILFIILTIWNIVESFSEFVL